MRIFFFAHSGLRYAVLFFAAVLVLACVLGLSTKKPGPKGVRVIGAIFVGLLDLQLLIGLILLVGGYYTPRALGHLAMMVLAAGAAHVTHVWGRKRTRGTYRWPLVGALLALLFITAGLWSIGRGPLTSTVHAVSGAAP